MKTKKQLRDELTYKNVEISMLKLRIETLELAICEKWVKSEIYKYKDHDDVVKVCKKWLSDHGLKPSDSLALAPYLAETIILLREAKRARDDDDDDDDDDDYYAF